MPTRLINVPVNIEIIQRLQKYPVYNPDRTLKEWVTKGTNIPAPNQKYFDLKNEYVSLVSKYRETQQEEFVGGMPVQLEKECMGQILRKDSFGNFTYHITLKVDGERYLLFLSRDGNVYFIDRSLMFYYLPDTLLKNRPPGTFLLDGEFVESSEGYEYLIFDTLFYNSNSVIEEKYSDRYNHAQDLVRDYFLKTVSLKSWFGIDEILKTDNIYSHVLKLTNKDRTNKLNADGLILQPFDTPYVTFGPWNKFNNVLFKWKPASELTIDFKLKIVNDNKWELLTKSGMNFDIKVMDPSEKLIKDSEGVVNPVDKSIMVHAIADPSDDDKRKYHNGDVVEVKYIPINQSTNKYGYKFKIVKPRQNKEANGLATIMSTMKVIKDPFNLDLLKKAIRTDGLDFDIYSKSSLILCILDIFFTKRETVGIKSVYDKYLNTPNAELEFRLLKNEKALDKFTFYYLFDFFNFYFKGTREITIDISSKKDSSGNVYRSTYSEYGKVLSNIIKRRVKDYTLKNDKDLYNKLNLKLSLSEEVPVENITQTGTRRVKDRTSFVYGLWRMDFTKVLTDSVSESFEVECEYIGSNTVPFEIFIKSLSNVYTAILKNSSFC